MSFSQNGNGSPPNAEETIYPPDHIGRTLILCFDGTGDQFDDDNSNIVEFFKMLHKDDREKQMVYYQAGIGTYVTPFFVTPIATKVSKMLDEAVAWNLKSHVMDGYEFLMQNYKAGDRISLFGFSRGAYTARALAGMISKVGLLPACNHQQVPFAYEIFSQDNRHKKKAKDGSTDEDKPIKKTNLEKANLFKETFSIDVKIDFIGVWDTVNSVGLIPRDLPFVRNNTGVRAFRHALALDERRSKFQPAFHANIKEAKKDSNAYGENPDSEGNIQLTASNKTKAWNRVEEVWFAGCHCDVGGGSVKNGVGHSLARIPLRWMIRECFKAKTGIMFTSKGLRQIGFDPVSLYSAPGSRGKEPSTSGAPLKLIPSSYHIELPALVPQFVKTFIKTWFPCERSPLLPHEDPHPLKSEEEHEREDALMPIYDQLALKWWFWWPFEYLPIRNKYYDLTTRKWEKKYKPNRYRPRFFPGHKNKDKTVKVHRSVRMRMEANSVGGTYEPKPWKDMGLKEADNEGRIIWVDSVE